MTSKQKIAIGPLSTKARGSHYQPSRADFTGYQVPVCNASSKAPLVMGQVWASAPRPGSLDYKRHPSKGGC